MTSPTKCDGPDAAEEARNLIARLEYIIDPTASAVERAHRRSHLTNHDIRLCIEALSRPPVATSDDALVEALRPFAAVADEYDDSEDDNFEVWVDAGPQKLIRASFKLSMYRAARAALSAATTPEAGARREEDITEVMWGGLARDIMMWLDMSDKAPRALFQHLDRTGHRGKIPQWLRDEAEMQNLDHTVSKGTRCVLIYRAMREATAALKGDA